ncbi:hypothetical protein [Pediococcus claussenii]|uniref:hypothetical protein n=1 Tax=Pediococcus claussenii TaxID=187452 RepID=UPI00081A63D3|nr:hypothetical protein [Pediococcus claussenii]ANZ70356.1 hypothetical protein AYR57_08525 [Pediococcus claussenii]ANZ72172.1 hypothetical protein AYR58_08525 [Pediococcus claussenii]
MNELKDNSFGFNANMKKVTLDKNGAQVLLTVDDLDFLEVNEQISKTAGYDVVVTVMPAQTELATDESQEADGQTEMDV